MYFKESPKKFSVKNRIPISWVISLLDADGGLYSISSDL